MNYQNELQNIIKEENRRKLDRPITGVIYKDRIWEQWYSEEAMNSEFPKMNQRDFLFDCNKNFRNQVIINNRGQKTFTVAQFEEYVDMFTNILFYGFGLKKGDIVCTLALSTPELVALKYAVTTFGAITCNLNFLDDEKVLISELNTIKPKMIFVLDIIENKVSPILNKSEFSDIIKVILPLEQSAKKVSIERVAISFLNKKNRRNGLTVNNAVRFSDFLKKYDEKKEKVKSVYDPNMPCNIAFTSGTTGQHKAVLLSHDANNALAYQQMLSDLELKRGIRHLALVPPFLAFWDADIMHCTLCLGAETILELNLSYESIPKYIDKYSPQMGAWSQWLWDSILHMPPKKLKKASQNLIGVIVGGERAEVNQQKSFYKKTGVFQSVGYGSSEVNTTFTYTHPNCKIMGASGIPFPFNNVKIVDKDFNDLTYNQPGRLLITSPCLMLGYFGRDDLTKEALYTDNEGTVWYDTKDYAYMDENGCLFVLDRDKPPVDIIVEDHTEKVNLLDIVETIKTERSIKICKLMNYEGRLILHAVTDEFCNIEKTEAVNRIVNRIKNALPEKYYPDIIRVLPALPRTPVGKVDYQKLTEDTAKLYSDGKYDGKLNVVIE